MNIQTLKGFRDFLPEEARKRQYAIGILKNVFESYGFEPLETPTLEYEDILTGKYGDEGDKLMYRFVDNGGRKVAMRYDQTVPLSRVIINHQNEIYFPFKRYQIQNVFRADNTQKGRFREFLQCDVDICGTDDPLSDAEIISLIYESFKSLGFKKFRILINDRTIFRGLSLNAISIIDKLKKIGIEETKRELAEIGVEENTLDNLLSSEKPESLEKILENSILLGVQSDKVVFEPTLARGLDYYTGLIIEVEIEDYNIGSVGGGGRYDNLIGMFSENQKIPAVGFAFGFDRIIEAMTEQNLFPETLDGTPLALVAVFKETLKESIDCLSYLRSNNISSEIYLNQNNKLDKQIKFADKKNIPFVIIIGEEEKQKNLAALKNLKTGEQTKLPLDEIKKTLEQYK